MDPRVSMLDLLLGVIVTISYPSGDSEGEDLGHTNLMFCFTSKPTQHFATLTLIPSEARFIL